MNTLETCSGFNSPSLVIACPTPCLSPGVVDEQGMRRLARELSLRGGDGLFVLGSTGEMVLVDESDRRALTVAAREGAENRSRVFVGIGGLGGKQGIRFSRQAAQDGADVVIAMAPFFQTLSQEELRVHVERIAEESPIPVGIYHHLRMTTPFAVETIARLAEHSNIVNYKDTSTDMSRLRQIIAATSGTSLKIYQGSESLILESLKGGAQGCVSALATISPEWHRQLIDAFRQENCPLAEQYQDRIDELLQLFKIPEVKTSLSHFVHTLKKGAQCRGWLTNPASLLAGFEPSEEFNRAILRILNDVQLNASNDMASELRTA